MILILLIGLALAATAVALVARAVAMPRVRAAETLETIDAYGFAGAVAAEPPRGMLRGVVDGVAGIAGGVLAGRLRGLTEAELRGRLMAAGMYATSPRNFLGYRILCALSVPVVWAWFASMVGYPRVLVVLGFIVAVFFGWQAPMVVVRSRTERRFARIDYELPELIDLLVVTVEAGLGFSGSLQIASSRFGGPLGDELRLMLQEQRMGLSTTESLTNMLARSDTPSMRSFVRSVVQGEALGVSIGQIMRNLATEMRKRRRAAAEERAQKAPIKLLFPLIFLIFPAMFVILLGPAIFAFIDAFGGR